MNTKTKNAPEILCRLLSPRTSKQNAVQLIKTLQKDEELFDLCIELANRHFLIPTLYSQLTKHKLLEELPVGLTDFMREMTEFMRNRNESLTALTEEIIFLCNQEDITPLLIKGASTLFSDIYPSTGIRFMSDLDIVFKEEEAIKAFHLLKSVGFDIPDHLQPTRPPTYALPESTVEDLPKHQHLLPIYRKGDACSIEIHHRPLSLFYFNYLHNEQAQKSASNIPNLQKNALNALQMTPINQLIHCFVHSELSHQNYHYKILDLRQMDYFVRMVHHFDGQFDWDELHQRIEIGGDQKVFQQYLFSINRLFGTEFPYKKASISNSELVKHYSKSLGSCYPAVNPLWKVSRFIAEFRILFSKKKLFHIYEIDTPSLLFRARILYSIRLLKKFYNPKSLYRRLKHSM